MTLTGPFQSGIFYDRPCSEDNIFEDNRGLPSACSINIEAFWILEIPLPSLSKTSWLISWGTSLITWGCNEQFIPRPPSSLGGTQKKNNFPTPSVPQGSRLVTNPTPEKHHRQRPTVPRTPGREGADPQRSPQGGERAAAVSAVLQRQRPARPLPAGPGERRRARAAPPRGGGQGPGGVGRRPPRAAARYRRRSSAGPAARRGAAAA